MTDQPSKPRDDVASAHATSGDGQAPPTVVDQVGGELRPAYDPPTVTYLGNMRELLAGTGSLPCDGTNIANGPDSAVGPIGTADQCGPNPT